MISINVYSTLLERQEPSHGLCLMCLSCLAFIRTRLPHKASCCLDTWRLYYSLELQTSVLVNEGFATRNIIGEPPFTAKA